MFVPIWLLLLTAAAFGVCALITVISIFAWLGRAAEIADLHARTVTLRLEVEHERWRTRSGRPDLGKVGQ